MVGHDHGVGKLIHLDPHGPEHLQVMYHVVADNALGLDLHPRKVGVRPLVNRFLRKTQRYYLADLSHSEKPLRWVVREAPRTVPRINENDPIVFDSHRYTWGGWARTCPAWGYSWMMLRSGPAGG